MLGEILEKSTRYCEECKVNKIAEWNHSGLCKECGAKQREQEKREARKRKTGEKAAKKKTGKIGKCRMCEREFELESWQHPSLCWCPECRKTSEYQNYHERFKA